MLVRTIAGFMVAAGVAVGCGGGGGAGISPRAACEDMWANFCERVYACYTDAEVADAGLPSTEAACVTMIQANRGCAAQTVENTCEGNARYHADQADICVDQISGLSCSQVRDDSVDLFVVAPACGKMCAID